MESWEGVTAHRASARRATRYLPALLTVIVAGCGSSGPPDPAASHSMAGVEAAGTEFVEDAATFRYEKACEQLTQRARAQMTEVGDKCPFTLALARSFLPGQVTETLRRLAREGQIVGDTAVYRGHVEAVYEDGRWHFEDYAW